MKHLHGENGTVISERWINKKSLAEALQISESYVNKLMKQQRIKAKKFGRTVRFKLSEVQQQLERGNSDE